MYKSQATLPYITPPLKVCTLFHAIEYKREKGTFCSTRTDLGLKVDVAQGVPRSQHLEMLNTVLIVLRETLSEGMGEQVYRCNNKASSWWGSGQGT